MSQEMMIVFSLCVIAAFLFGFVGGINLEYHTSKQMMQRQQETEKMRLQNIAALVNGERE